MTVEETDLRFGQVKGLKGGKEDQMDEGVSLRVWVLILLCAHFNFPILYLI